MDWLLDQLTNLLLLLAVVLVVMALLSPFEALGWWAGWSHGELHATVRAAHPEDQPEPRPEVSHYVVFLTGVGGFSGEFLRPPEDAFITSLQQRLPGAVIVRDVFPYSVNNTPLDGQRLLAGLWRWLQKMRSRVPDNIFDVLIIVRNALQVGVSADPRYGPIYNHGVAREIVKSLHRHGYPAGDEQAVYFIGYSGGVQVALGAAPYLRRTLRAPLHVISIGGVMASDPGIMSVEHIHHFYGSRDPLPLLGVVLYPGRWPVASRSAWNRARRAGMITSSTIGPIKHFGHQDYFSDSATLAGGRTHLEQTIELVAGVITGSVDRRPPT